MITDSKLARFVAGKEWPDVQEQKKIASGVFWFMSAGHGGCVARLDRFSPEAQEALRKAELVERVLSLNGGLFYGRDHDWSGLHEAAGGVTTEVAVGEEDCAWAALFLADPELIGAANLHMGGYERLTLKSVAETCERWYPEFAAELGYVKDPD